MSCSFTSETEDQTAVSAGNSRHLSAGVSPGSRVLEGPRTPGDKAAPLGPTVPVTLPRAPPAHSQPPWLSRTPEGL